MLPELASLCRQTVTIAPRSGVDGYGEATYGAAVSYRAYVEGRRRLVAGDRGDQVLSTHTVYLAVQSGVGAHDRITLSTSDVYSTESGVLQPPILSVVQAMDDLGRRHTVLYLA